MKYFNKKELPEELELPGLEVEKDTEEAEEEYKYLVEPFGLEGSFALFFGKKNTSEMYRLCVLSDFDSSAKDTLSMIVEGLNGLPEANYTISQLNYEIDKKEEKIERLEKEISLLS